MKLQKDFDKKLTMKDQLRTQHDGEHQLQIEATAIRSLQNSSMTTTQSKWNKRQNPNGCKQGLNQV